MLSRLIAVTMLLVALLTSPAVAADRLVHLVNLGWHTGIAIRTADIDPDSLPEVIDFLGSPWIEVGWGDRAFYQDPDPAVASYFSALFVKTPAVLHVVGMPAPPARYFPTSEVVDVPLDQAGFDRLIAFISETFDRTSGKPAPAVGAGLYPDSRFYDALGTFTLENTCNTWVARGFAAAGLPIDPSDVVRASTVTARVRAAVASDG